MGIHSTATLSSLQSVQIDYPLLYTLLNKFTSNSSYYNNYIKYCVLIKQQGVLVNTSVSLWYHSLHEIKDELKDQEITGYPSTETHAIVIKV